VGSPRLDRVTEQAPPGEDVRRLVKAGRIVSDMPFTELLRAFDAVVFDIPSTAMLEAMQTDRPMLVMADSRCITLLPEARQSLRRRVRLAEDPDEFIEALGEFLALDYEAERNADREFIRSYGTHLDDGHSADRAARAVIELAR
jgi:hypothetical protein